MTLSIETEPIPLDTVDGTVRVRGTRVTLDTIVYAFHAGASPEDIADRFPAVALDDAYAVILYYLRHREQVDSYLAEREVEANEIQKTIETRFDKTGLRERLLARREQRSR